MNSQESEGARMDADIALPAHLASMFSKLETKEGETIDGRATWQVIGSREGKPPVRLFLDQESGLLLRLIRYVDSPLGLNPLQIDLCIPGGFFSFLRRRRPHRCLFKIIHKQRNPANCWVERIFCISQVLIRKSSHLRHLIFSNSRFLHQPPRRICPIRRKFPVPVSSSFRIWL